MGKHSGKSRQIQEKLNELLNYIREGDIVVVTKLDRLERSLSQCLKTDYASFCPLGISIFYREKSLDF
ncbi:recombinase family protein [Avibacterium avium]|uniref:recombinase family protein n=1 Tax=Avibacterium avium TaxID=751 RepID=UPI003BF8D662